MVKTQNTVSKPKPYGFRQGTAHLGARLLPIPHLQNPMMARVRITKLIFYRLHNQAQLQKKTKFWGEFLCHHLHKMTLWVISRAAPESQRSESQNIPGHMPQPCPLSFQVKEPGSAKLVTLLETEHLPNRTSKV